MYGQSNVVLQSRQVEAFEVAFDPLSRPPRYWALRMEWMTGGRKTAPYTSYESLDGLRWRRIQDDGAASMVMADRSTFFLNPLRSPPHWVFSLRENLCAGGPSGHMRARRYWERPHGSSRTYSKTWIKKYYQCEPWRPNDPVPWYAVDEHDCGYKQCDLYNLDGLAYESILLHGLAILHGPNSGGELKNNSIHLGFSRDGFHLARPPPPRRPFIALPSRVRNVHGKWLGLSNAQLASGSPIISRNGSTLLFYFGFGGSDSYVPGETKSVYTEYMEATGVAALRRDGFASLAAPASTGRGGQLTTRPLVYNGSRLFVNAILAPRATLRVEVLQAASAHRGGDGGSVAADGAAAHGASHASGQPAARNGIMPFCGFALHDAVPLIGPLDSTRVEVPSRRGFRFVAGQRVRLRFTLSAGARLYAFWLTDSVQGRSGGFLGGGAFGVPRRVDS